MPAMKKNLLFAAVILVVFLLFYCLRGDYGIALNLQDEVLTVDGPEGFLYSVPYDRMESVELCEDLELGACNDGGEKYGYQFGLWVNPSLGQYQLCVMKNNNNYIVIKTNDGAALVFNKENAETTKEFYQAFKQVLFDSGYSALF